LAKEFYKCFGKDSEATLKDIDEYARNFGNYKITGVNLNENATIYIKAGKITTYKIHEIENNRQSIF